MRPCVLALGLATATLTAHAVLAQDSSAGADAVSAAAALAGELDLATAIEQALARDPALQARRAQADADRLKPAIERSLMPPRADFTIWQWPLTTINPANVDMYMFMFEQEFPGKGKRDARAHAAEEDARISDAETAVRTREVIAEVKRAYVQLAEARRIRALYDEALRLVRELADAAEVKYGTGRVPQQDVLKAVVELSVLHRDIVSIEEASSLAEARLNTLLGRSPYSPIGPLTTRLAPAPPLTDLPALIDLAAEHQPDLAVIGRSADRFEASAAAAEAEKKPDFMVRGGYMLMPGSAGAVTASVGVSWPNAPWSRDRLDATVAERRAQAAATQARLAAVRADVGRMTQEAHVRYTAASRRAELLRSSILPQTAQTLSASRIAYETDRADILTLIDTERAYLAAAIELERTTSEVEQALADLERAVGADLTVGVPVPPAVAIAATPEPRP